MGVGLAVSSHSRQERLLRLRDLQHPMVICLQRLGGRVNAREELPGLERTVWELMIRLLRTLLTGSVLFVSLLGAATWAAPEFLIAGGRPSTTMPFELIGNHIYVRALLNGKGSYYFALDSGAHDFVTPAVAEALGLEPTQVRVRLPNGGRHTYLDWSPVASVQFGDLTLRDQPFAVIPFDHYDNVEGVTPFGGLLGCEVLKAFVVRIDYERRLLTFTKPEQFQAPTAALPLTFVGDIPQVKARLDGMAGVFNIDTGDRRSLELFRDFIAKNGLRAKYPPKVQAMTGWGIRGPVRSDLARAGALEFGGFTVTRPVVEMDLPQGGAFDFPHTAGNIGADILRQFTVTLDYSRKRMFLDKNADFGRPVTFDRAGLWLNREGERFVVIDVVPDGQAAQAGIDVGDLVTALDGLASAKLSLSLVRRELRESPAGTRVRMTVQPKGGGPAREVVVTLKEQV